jgi:hypothetical protein
MKSHMVSTLFLPALLVMTANTGCSLCNTDDDGNNSMDAIRQITYAFGDAPVAPEYHRSYTITVTTTTARVVIDSYGETLADEEYLITTESFEEVRNALATNQIRNCLLPANDGCVGGTSQSISYSDEDTELFSGSAYYCGGESSGDLCGDVASFADTIKSVVPDFEALLDGTRS